MSTGGGAIFDEKELYAAAVQGFKWLELPTFIIGGRGVTGFLRSLNMNLCEERRLEDTQNLKCEDRRFQNCLVLATDDLATKPTKLED